MLGSYTAAHSEAKAHSQEQFEAASLEGRSGSNHDLSCINTANVPFPNSEIGIRTLEATSCFFF